MGNTFLVSFRSAVAVVACGPCGQRGSVVHKSTGPSFGFAQAVAAMSDDAEHDRVRRRRSKSPSSFSMRPTGSPTRACADVDRVAAPSDLAVVAHAPDLVIGAIARLAQHAVEAPRRGSVMLGRACRCRAPGAAAPRCRAAGSGASAPTCSRRLRGRRIGGVAASNVRCSRSSRPFCCGLPGAMRSGTTPALIDLDRQPRQAAGAARGERRPVVGAQPTAAGRTRGRPRPAPARHAPYRCAPSPGSATDSGCARRSASAARNARRRRSGTSP